jgi:Flp pilus assembly protein TadD
VPAELPVAQTLQRSDASFVAPPPPPTLEALAARHTPATPFAATMLGSPAVLPVAASPVAASPVAAVAPQAMAAVAPQPAAVVEADFAPIVPVRGPSRTPLLVAIAAVGIVSGVGLGLAVLRGLTPKAAPEAPAAVAPAAPTPKPAAAAPTPEPAAAAKAPEPVAAPVPAAAAPATVSEATEPKPSASSTAIPWDDLPQTTAKTCEELAQVGTGPKGFLLQQAVTSAQHALLQGDTAAAHTAFCTAAQLGVPSDTVLLGLTQVLLMQGDPTAALKMVDQLLEGAPTNKKALEWRGDILIRLGRVEDAKQAWFKSAGATRASKQLIDNLVRTSDADTKLALRSGDLSRADRMLRRVIALTEGDPEHCRQLVAVLTKNGSGAAAERWRAYVSTLG